MGHVVSTPNHLSVTHVHVMCWVHTNMFHPAASPPLLPLMLLALVGKFDPDGLVDSIQLHFSIKRIYGSLGHLPFPELDESTAILGRLVMFLLDDVHVCDVSIGSKYFADEVFICISG